MTKRTAQERNRQRAITLLQLEREVEVAQAKQGALLLDTTVTHREMENAMHELREELREEMRAYFDAARRE